MPQPRNFRLERLTATPLTACIVFTIALLFAACTPKTDNEEPAAEAPKVAQTLEARQAGDFSEVCIWNHPQTSNQSLVFAADGESGDLFAFGLDGAALQSIASEKAAGIDVRYDVAYGDDVVHGTDTSDILVFLNTASPAEIRIYAIDSEHRSLDRVDSGIRCSDGADGGALTTSRASGGMFYFASNSKTGLIEQYTLSSDSLNGGIKGEAVREWTLGSAGDILADDQAGIIFVAEPDKGVWRLHGAPQGETPGELRIKVGENGLKAVGQLAMYKRREGDGYIMVADGKDNKVHLYKRRANNAYVGSFELQGSPDDGAMAIVSAEMDSRFLYGMFVSESEDSDSGARLNLTPWETIADMHGFNVDNSWDPRK